MADNDDQDVESPEIQVRFIGPSKSGRAYESPQDYHTVAEAADSLYENGFRKLSGEPGPSAFLYGPDGITAHRGLSMPSNKWVAILDAVRNQGRETEFWADFYGHATASAAPSRPPVPETDEAYVLANIIYNQVTDPAFRFQYALSAACAAIEQGFRKTPATSGVTEQVRAEAERQRIALADALRLSHALTTDQLIDHARETWDWAANFFAGRAEMRRERDEARAALAAAQAPAASEQPALADMPEHAWRSFHETATGRPAASGDTPPHPETDTLTEDMTHNTENTDTTTEVIEQAARAFHAATDPKTRWDELAPWYQDDCRRGVRAAAELLATNQAHDEAAQKRFTNWMAERLANYAAKWDADRERIKKALAPLREFRAGAYETPEEGMALLDSTIAALSGTEDEGNQP